MKGLIAIVAAMALALLAGAAQAGSVSLVGLGDLPGGTTSSKAWAISGDGSVVVGSSDSGNSEAFSWTASGGMVALGTLPTHAKSEALGVNYDGSLIVGYSNTSSTYTPVFWSSTGIQQVGSATGGRSQAVSSNGSIVVGAATNFSNPSEQAFRWTDSGGLVGLGGVQTTVSQSKGLAMSADGSVVVGVSRDGAVTGNYDQAFRWTAATGTVGLGFLTGATKSIAEAISDDGLVVFGKCWAYDDPATEMAYRWTESEGMVSLGLPAGYSKTAVFGASYDGSVAVGRLTSTSNVKSAAIWDAVNGWRRLEDVLAAGGVDLTGWQLTCAYGVSDDGLKIVGFGTNSLGNTEAFLATVPEPGTMALLAVGGLGFVGRAIRRRRQRA